MVVLVSVDTLLLVLLSIIAVGLLRGYAELIRRQESPPASSPSVVEFSQAIRQKEPPTSGIARATDISGESLTGERVHVALHDGTSTLIAFLTSTCELCERFWKSLGAPEPAGILGNLRLVVVTRDRNEEILTRLRNMAPPDVTVVMSTASWDAYGVPVRPYFVYVEGRSGLVRGEGAARTWSQVLSLLED